MNVGWRLGERLLCARLRGGRYRRRVCAVAHGGVCVCRGGQIYGVLEYQCARIQLLDLPGIVEGASQGRGRGRQVVSTAKTADLILIMLDATKSDEQRRLLEIELDAVGIRLNKMKPDVVFKRKTTGGVGQLFTTTQLLRSSPTRTRLDHCK